MIKGEDIHKYTLDFVLDNSSGWHYGPSTINIHHLHPQAPQRYWWASCRVCGEAGLCTLREVQVPTDCRSCAADWTDPDYDWQADRSMRAWDTHQETMTSAFILGGIEAVQALALGLHRGRMAAVEAHKAKLRNPGSVIEPKGAHLQEAEPEAP